MQVQSAASLPSPASELVSDVLVMHAAPEQLGAKQAAARSHPWSHPAAGSAPGVLAGEVRLVHAAQHQLAAGRARRIAVQPEAEHGRRHQALVHRVLERRRRAAHRDLWERQALHARPLLRSRLTFIACGHFIFAPPTEVSGNARPCTRARCSGPRRHSMPVLVHVMEDAAAHSLLQAPGACL